jgi:hypothetical protein
MTAQTSHRGSETDPPKFIKHIVDQQTEQPDEDRMKPMDHVVVPIRRQNSTSTAIEIALDIPNLGKESCIQNAELLVQLAGGLPADELALEAEGPEGFKFVNFVSHLQNSKLNLLKFFPESSSTREFK